jgi:stage V sporulation protein AE
MAAEQKRNIIIVTDGDKVASRAVQRVATEVGGRCISRSAGNPTPLSGEQIVEQIIKAAYDPVFVMFDDNGQGGFGDGEKALEFVANHPSVNVLGAIAVASNTEAVEGAQIDMAIDGQGHVVESGVNKDGDVITYSQELRIYGDTVDVLEGLQIPMIVGIGDIGKMNGHDHIRYGCPITKKAVEVILERSGFHASR